MFLAVSLLVVNRTICTNDQPNRANSTGRYACCASHCSFSCILFDYLVSMNVKSCHLSTLSYQCLIVIFYASFIFHLVSHGNYLFWLSVLMKYSSQIRINKGPYSLLHWFLMHSGKQQLFIQLSPITIIHTNKFNISVTEQ